MGKIRQINIKNRTYYFYNDQIDLKDFDARLLKIDKKDYNEIDICYIGYVTKLMKWLVTLNAIPLRKKMKISI